MNKIKLESKSYNLYANLGYWFLSLVILVLVGFYPTYFSIFFTPMPSITHIHFALMTVWITMLIIQPFLIKYKKLAAHRMIGKVSYVLVPFVMIFTYLMMRHGYLNYVNRVSRLLVEGHLQYSGNEIRRQAAKAYGLPFFYLLWLGLFYLLAIINKKRSSVHARYMMAAALTILGPTIDRIVSVGFKIETLFYIPAFVLIDTILLSLSLKDRAQQVNTNALWICLSIYTVCQVIYLVVQDASWWGYFMASIMNS
ncbi:MAG TPA: hypothetical protein VL443_19080 [Cyclobacteriaceae bacterium]|jgi:hypothetical protein|nr:hypothetical protein [Cyclobacteriaceae bacterium]